MSNLAPPGRPRRQTYRRANTSLNLSSTIDAISTSEGGAADNSEAPKKEFYTSIVDKYTGKKPTKDNYAVLNGNKGSGPSLKEFLLGRGGKEPLAPSGGISTSEKPSLVAPSAKLNSVSTGGNFTSSTTSTGKWHILWYFRINLQYF